jgi:hypothetical protein
MHTKCLSKNLKKRDHLGYLVIDAMIMLKLILKKQGVRVWTGFTCLRIRISGGFLKTQ